MSRNADLDSLAQFMGGVINDDELIIPITDDKYSYIYLDLTKDKGYLVRIFDDCKEYYNGKEELCHRFLIQKCG